MVTFHASQLAEGEFTKEHFMHQTIYDSIGSNYNKNRTADVRILTAIRDLLELPLGSTIADIGAGTGNYSNALAELGYKITAVEPSAEMRKQAIPNKNVKWLAGTAEAVPLDENSVNGVIIVLALHHFSNLQKAAQEMARICPNGPVVIFTMDPRESEAFWFNDYFPEISLHVAKSLLPINEVTRLIAAESGWPAIIKKFPLPHDLADKNMCSGWNRPEIYLDEQMRQNTSGFALASQDAVRKGLARLQEDLNTGKWDKNCGFLRKRDTFDAGFRLIRFRTQAEI
jgi:ubiquinone/menaquinone biosynthesis C-methylase UbiE